MSVNSPGCWQRKYTCSAARRTQSAGACVPRGEEAWVAGAQPPWPQGLGLPRGPEPGAPSPDLGLGNRRSAGAAAPSLHTPAAAVVA